MPDQAFLTVDEAARVLRIGRTAAYAATRRWRDTGGAEGIPVIQVGGSLRVPRRWLEQLAGGPVEPGAPIEPQARPDRSLTQPEPSTRTETTRSADQTALPFSA
jgi:hypothetical protein